MTPADTSPPTLAALEQVLRDRWGYPAFRPSQIPVVMSALKEVTPWPYFLRVAASPFATKFPAWSGVASAWWSVPS